MRKRILVVALVFGPFLFLAQPDIPGMPPCEEIGGPPMPGFGEPCIPIDGGISLLIAAGLAYGGKRSYDGRKRA